MYHTVMQPGEERDDALNIPQGIYGVRQRYCYRLSQPKGTKTQPVCLALSRVKCLR